MKEQWKVIDFASNYEVSNTGFIRNKTTKYILKGRETFNGYLQVSLKIDEKNKFINKYVHRLVAQFWLENINNKEEVNHIDGNKKIIIQLIQNGLLQKKILITELMF